jgi:predicted dehydrogenase
VALRVGVVGAGLWARRAHLPALARTPGVAVTAISDPDRARAEALARDFGVDRAFADHEQLLASGVDAIAIVAPDDAHHAVAAAALAARLPVLCEKPLARTVAEAAALARQAEAAGVVTKMGFGFRYSPALRRLAEMVAEGRIGRPHTLTLVSQNGQFRDPAAPLHWKMERARAGGGVFVEYGVHALDLARWLGGEVVEVCANARTVVGERVDATGARRRVDTDDVCSWLASLAGGAEAVFHASWASLPAPGADLAIFGDAGALAWRRVDEPWPFGEVLGATPADPVLRPLPVPGRLLAGLEWATTWRECFMGALVRRFVAEVTGAVPVEGPTFADGYRAQLALAAVATSLAEHRWVAVAGEEPRPAPA